jgi:hypothetical protein
MSVLGQSEARLEPKPLRFENPLRRNPVVAVTSVGEAEGSRAAAAALACAGAGTDVATLLVDVGGRVPRPTLIASAAAQKLEERLSAHLPESRVAARGLVCHLFVPAGAEGLDAASAAASVARDALTVLHLPSGLLQAALAEPNLRPSGALLRADLCSDRALVALVVRDLLERGLTAGVLKRRLSWMAERRALFGVLPPGSPGALPERLARRLTGAAG